jgi:hypothetical protein
MALNFGVLDQGGPSNFFEGYSQGQEKMQANEMAQQRAAQAQQEFGMRQQEFAASQADKKRAADASRVAQKLASYEEAFLKASSPEAAKGLIKIQFDDPDVGPIRSRLGSLEQALAEVPDEPTAFQGYLNQEAMGIKEFRKQKYRESQVAGLFGDGAAPAPTNAMAPAGAMPQAAPVANAMAPAAPNVADLVRRRNQALALGETAIATALNSDIARLSPAAPTTPTSVSEYNFAVQQGYKGSLFDFKRDLANAGRAPGTTVNMVSERAEQGARGKMLVDQYSDIAKAAGLAARTLPSIEVNLSALNKGFDTGFGKETIAAGASVLASLGVPEAAKFATDTQKFQSNAISAVLQKQLEQKGPQTESDARRIEQIGAQLGKTKQANEFILSMAGELLRRDIDQRNFYDRWYKTNKTYDGAENAWFGGEGGKSLFDRPGLKKYSAPAPAAVGGLSPAEQAELDQLRKQVGGKK